MTYEELLLSPDADGVGIVDYNFQSERIDGLYCNGMIAISDKLHTNAERFCILAEELGHHHTSAGDIIDQSSAANRKQELRARAWAYNKLIGLTGIVDCCKSKCQCIADMADHLGVSEDFLKEAIHYYRSKYGICAKLDNYVIYFEPSIRVFELI